jgi:hypothetical protein
MPEYTVINGKRAEMNLRRLSFGMRYIAPAFDTIGGRFRSQVEAQFALGGALPGVSGPWAPLSPFTRSMKGSGRILIDRTLLLQSYTDTRAAGNINDISNDRARFGSGFKTRNEKGKRIPVAKFHQEGTEVNGRLHMPARPVILGNRFLDEEICDAFVDHLFKAWR